jgi:CBS domain containing-hemolysin-like protein
LEGPGLPVVALISGVVTFFFSLAEGALAHFSPPRLLEIARRRKREDALEPFLEADERILLTCQLLALVAAVVFVLGILAAVAGPESLDAWTLAEAGLVSAAILLTVGRVLPLHLGKTYADRIVYALRPVLQSAHLVFGPLSWLLAGMRLVTDRIAGREANGEGHEQMHDEILSAVEEAEMEGAIREDEAEMIERALHLKDADVADAMTPRTDMFALKIDTPIAEAVQSVSDEGHSRVPVYRENIDQIDGILYAKDILSYWGAPGADDLDLATIARKPFFVPETKKIGQLLDEFKRTKLHIAIVLDEYGGTAGLITIEDILEEIVGDIEDEYDDSMDSPLLERTGEAEAEVDARVHVDELADELSVELPSDEFDSVGGLVFTVLGRIPDPGDQFDYAGLHFTVLDADERRVNRVRVVRNSS